MTTLVSETYLPEYEGVIRSIVLIDSRLINVLFNLWGRTKLILLSPKPALIPRPPKRVLRGS